MLTIPSNFQIILASTSPRRHALLQQVAVPHHILAVNIDETQLTDETAIDYIQRMVGQKATAATALMSEQDSAEFIILTADTIGVLPSGQVLQKPVDFADACQMWRQMSGNWHQVWTAVQTTCIQNKDNQPTVTWQQQVTVKTEVAFIDLTDKMMVNYWQTGEPQDKAGGYAIQGLGGAWVRSINGSYSNVVGLPLVETLELIELACDEAQTQ